PCGGGSARVPPPPPPQAPSARATASPTDSRDSQPHAICDIAVSSRCTPVPGARGLYTRRGPRDQHRVCRPAGAGAIIGFLLLPHPRSPAMSDVVIVGAKRTANGSMLGQFTGVPTPTLGAAAIRAAVEQAGVKGEDVSEVIMGCVLPANLGQAPARQASLAA